MSGEYVAGRAIVELVSTFNRSGFNDAKQALTDLKTSAAEAGKAVQTAFQPSKNSAAGNLTSATQTSVKQEDTGSNDLSEEAFFLTRKGQLFSSYYGDRLAELRKYEAQNSSSAYGTYLKWHEYIKKLEADWNAASRTMLGGMRQAMSALSYDMGNWTAQWRSMADAAASQMATGIKAFCNTADSAFLNLGKLATSVFESIRDAFFDMLAQMAAKAAMYGLFDLVTGGFSGAFGGFAQKLLGFAEGGLVPGPAGAAMMAVVHGGEYVLPGSVVSAIKAGQPPSGMDASGANIPAAGGQNISISIPAININGGMSSQTDVKAVAEELSEAIRRGVTQAVDLARVSYKVGYARRGETAL